MLSALFITSCDMGIDMDTTGTSTNTGTSGYKNFVYDLQGRWVSIDPSVYSGTLVITNDKITISGYEESQTLSGEDHNKRPFKDFTKGIALSAYSEGEKIFINDAGVLQTGIPYYYYTVGTYPQEKFLRLDFGGRTEILRKS